MKYYKTNKNNSSNSLIAIFLILLSVLAFINRDILYRSIITINLGSLYVQLINKKADLVSFLNNNNNEVIDISMSPNNFVRLQKERSRMVSNYVLDGSQWTFDNTYFKANILRKGKSSKAKIKLFGMNPDHYRSSSGHSFRIQFDGEEGFGNKKVNFLNLRSRDFITDPLVNIIYKKIYSGIGIKYNPIRVILNKTNYGVFYMEDFFDKYLIEENNRRESLIFEIVNDSLYFNHLGEDDMFLSLGKELNNKYINNYNDFLNIIDYQKLRSIIYLSIIINDSHPLSDINMHWYFNPVTGLIEPTIREGFAYEIDSIDINRIISNNRIINDLFTEKIDFEFKYDLKNDLNKIDSIINFDKDYLKLKKKLVGYKSEIQKKENIIRDNIKFLNQNLEIAQNQVRKNTNKKVFKIQNDTIIKDNLTINKDTKLIISPGVKITLDNTFIKVYGEILAKGTEKKQIEINGKENSSGTIFINSSKKVELSYVNFNNLSNKFSNYDQPSSILFYECTDVVIDNSTFSNNKSGDDYLNFFRSSNITITNSFFKDVLNDAIDSDFSAIYIKNSVFENIGNDAIDGSGSNLDIQDSSFTQVLDKAISAGENSDFIIKNSLFIKNEIAIVAKDQSKLISNNNKLIDNKVDFAAFRKKRIYGPSYSEFAKTKIINYLVEENSIVKGINDLNFTSDVESKLYGNIYGRASE